MMLAQNFKSPINLGLSREERDALIKVLGMLERDELQCASIEHPTIPNGFNMESYLKEGECGTAACLAGWAYLISGRKQFTFANPFAKEQFALSAELDELFHPTAVDWEKITPQHGAAALRSFLTTGAARWEDAMASE